ncbi:MAG: hypothetical protein WC476_07875 [Phycisphaerae bacterium]|jgi:hypothetical protein
MNNKLQLTGDERRVTSHESRKVAGSAIILTVVLNSILAIIGMMFIMIARVDRMATSNISENKTLNYAVEAVVTKISEELVSDVPGMSAAEEYYDYPGNGDAWLASIEPYLYDNNDTPTDISDDTYKWGQISDVTGYLFAHSFPRQNVNVDPDPPFGTPTQDVIREYPEIQVDASGSFLDENGNLATDGISADADGDGIADSKWIELENITSDKGKPIYAAIRIIDNGGMVNVNTAYKFDPGSTVAARIDGSSQMQIDLETLAETGDLIADVNIARNPIPKLYSEYQDDVVWSLGVPNINYRPFDISDELELRYRYCINSQAVTRLEDVWPNTTGSSQAVPYDASSGKGLTDWCKDITHEVGAGNPDTRHMLTTYNMDRIITPDCNKMININSDSNVAIYNAIKDALGSSYSDADAAQLTVNLIDYVDGNPAVSSRPDPDNEVSVYRTPDNSVYYGFEQPCVYISELARRFKPPSSGAWSFPSQFDLSYAIELHKPYPEEDYPKPSSEWRLVTPGYGTVPITWSGTRSFHVVYFKTNTSTLMPITFTGDQYPDIGSPDYQLETLSGPGVQVFWPDSVISLQRKVGADWLTVDTVTVPNIDASEWEDVSDKAQSVQRDITPHKCIRRLWDPGSTMVDTELGTDNTKYVTGDSIYIQAHPANSDFNNVGEIGMLFVKSAYDIGMADTEETARLNLAGLNEPNLFKYLTVFDPNSDGINNDGDGKTSPSDPGWIDAEDMVDPKITTPEWKVPGRININTAPWYVLAQLPWVSQREGGSYDDPNLAKAIAAYRDKVDLSSTLLGGPNYSGLTGRATATGITGVSEVNGFSSIGELNYVIGGSRDYHIDYYDEGDPTNMGNDLLGFPDLTPGTAGDDAPDDFEERDLIFARISNLVTVRSDVFTAYILVRVGTDGPQKRVVAILDRSDVYPNPDYPATSLVPYFGKVKIRAMQLVPDPR